jgi:hypothetical protein
MKMKVTISVDIDETEMRKRTLDEWDAELEQDTGFTDYNDVAIELALAFVCGGNYYDLVSDQQYDVKG